MRVMQQEARKKTDVILVITVTSDYGRTCINETLNCYYGTNYFHLVILVNL